MHAATFGGNPIAARAGLAAIEMIEQENLLEHAREVSDVFRARLEALRSECELVRDVRVLGLMIGVELSVEGAPVVKKCLERRLLINCTQGTVIRLLPAMNLTDEKPTKDATSWPRRSRTGDSSSSVGSMQQPSRHDETRHLTSTLCDASSDDVTDLTAAEIERIFAITEDLKTKYAAGPARAAAAGPRDGAAVRKAVAAHRASASRRA